MKVAVLADIGQPVYHVGDEAIAHAVRDALRARGVRPVLLTRDARHTGAYFGPVSTAPTLEFPWPPAERERRLAAIEAYAAGDARALPDGDPARAFCEVVRSVDALLVAGGGNATSRYGWLMYERIAAIRVAERYGKPVVLTGQTLGPELTRHDRDELASALAACALVSLREHSSVALGRELAPAHPAIVGGMDDAAAWRSSLPPHQAESASPRVVVTLASGTGPVSREDAVPALAGLLDAFAVDVGADVELLPHMATPGCLDGDLAFNAEVVEASRSGRLVASELPTAAEAADAVTGADLVLTSRYHPAVFAATRGVPVFALAPDHYSDVRIDGALAHHGLAGRTIPITALSSGDAANALAAAWAERHEVREHLGIHHDRLLTAHAGRWDELVSALGGRSFTLHPWEPAPALRPPAEVEEVRNKHLPALRSDSAALVRALEQERTASYIDA